VAIGTCGVVEPDGDLSQANKAWPSPSRELAASPERYGAGELLFLACRDDLPALLRSGADAAAVGAGGGVRLRRGRCFARDWRIAVWIGGVRNRGGNSACPLSARDGERLVRVEESVARSSFLVGSMEGNQSCILLGFSLLNCTPERPLARYARVRCSPALLLLPRLPAYCLRLSYAVCQLAVAMLYVVLLRVELDEEESVNLWVF
jgi:hypothetical protein